jgi:hypothetical protein
VALVLVGLGLCLSTPAWASHSPDPGLNRSFGRDLDTWQELYWRWAFGDVSIPTDGNGNAVVGNVVLMPIPSTPGDGTPGSVDVTLTVGQSFILPLWALLGTSYTDGTPPDPFEPVSVFETLEITFTIDGEIVVNSGNVMSYFSQGEFDPEIPLPPDFAPFAAIIWFQSVGILHTPLRPGQHVLKLDVKNTQPAFGFIAEYHNTWNVTVTRHRHD